jgi:hypothetical protein
VALDQLFAMYKSIMIIVSYKRTVNWISYMFCMFVSVVGPFLHIYFCFKCNLLSNHPSSWLHVSATYSHHQMLSVLLKLLHCMSKLCIMCESYIHSLMELSPAWEATNCAATQELLSILWNLKAHYDVHKGPPLFPILCQINPVHIIPSYLSKIHFNIIRPPTSWSSKWSLSLWYSHQYPICIYLLLHSCYSECDIS